jgi:hypothetical protein
MGSENNYDESAGGVTIDQERAEYHLRCMGTDCGWRADEVADFIKDQQMKVSALCKAVGERGVTIMKLEEAVRVLAASVRSNANDRAVGKHWDEEVCDEVWANEIAAEAVRKAGG